MGYACEDCNNYVYDEDEEAYICVQDMDEDDFYKVMSSIRWSDTRCNR